MRQVQAQRIFQRTTFPAVLLSTMRGQNQSIKDMCLQAETLVGESRGSEGLFVALQSVLSDPTVGQIVP